MKQHNAHNNRRRNFRLPIQTPVSLKGGPWQGHQTEDISYEGLFVNTTTPLEPRQIAQFQITLPDTKETLQMMAVVARSVSVEIAESTGQSPGMGLLLYRLNPHQRQSWESFVSRMGAEYRKNHPTLGKAHAISTEPRMPEYVLRFEDVVALSSVLNWDFVYGGMFLKTIQLVEKASKVRLLFAHPEGKSQFPVLCTVEDVVFGKTPDDCGMSVTFDEVTPQTIEAFQRFVENGIPFIHVEDVLTGTPWMICEDSEGSEDAGCAA